MDTLMTWLARLQSNPLIVRSIRQPSQLSMRRGLRYALRLALVISFLCILQAFTGREVGLTAFMLLLVAIIMITTPPFVAYAAGTVTIQELLSEQYELVHVTALSNARLIEGHVFRALHRCRFLLLLIATVSPFFILGLIVYQGYIQCSGGRYMPVIYPSCQSFMPLPPDAGLLAITGLVIIAAEPRELTIVNLVGPIDLDRLAGLQGQFGIPKISTEVKVKP